MSVVNHTTLVDNAKMKVIQWAGLGNGDTGQPYTFSGQYPIKSVQLTGTLGAAGQCDIEGSNIVTTPVWAVLNDKLGNALGMDALGIKSVGENTYQIRPNVSAGDGTTDLTLTAILWK